MKMKRTVAENKMLLTTFLLWFSVYTYPSFLSAYVQEELQASAVLIGAITGSYGFVQMLLRIPLGICSDLWGKRKPFLLLGAASTTLAALGLIVSRTATGVLIFRGLSGLGASTWVMYTVLYSASVPQERISHAMSTLSFYQYGSQVIAMILGAFLADRFGKWAAFSLALAAGVVGFVVNITIKEDVQGATTPAIRELPQVLKSKALLRGTALSTIFNFISWGTVLGFTINWAKTVIGLTTTQLGFLSAAYLLPNTITGRFAAALEAKFGRRVMLTGGFLIVALAAYLYAYSATAVQLFAIQVAFGCGMGLIMPLNMADAIAEIPGEKRGAAMGFYQSVYGIGMFLGPVIAGAIVAANTIESNMIPGYQANFRVMALIGLFGALVSFVTSGTKNRRKKA